MAKRWNAIAGVKGGKKNQSFLVGEEILKAGRARKIVAKGPFQKVRGITGALFRVLMSPPGPWEKNGKAELNRGGWVEENRDRDHSSQGKRGWGGGVQLEAGHHFEENGRWILAEVRISAKSWAV